MNNTKGPYKYGVTFPDGRYTVVNAAIVEQDGAGTRIKDADGNIIIASSQMLTVERLPDDEGTKTEAKTK